MVKASIPHVAAMTVLAAFTLLWSLPLAQHLSSSLPGGGPGDNVAFVWNFWWMRYVLMTGGDFFYTSHLFAPIGTNLTANTHTALPAVLGATIFKPFPIVCALNVTTLVSLFLNAFCTYLLAWRLVHSWSGAIIAAFVFAGSPYMAAHLNGHFNLTTAWSIPLLAIAVSKAMRSSVPWSVLAGAIVGATVYIDYYYVVYEAALAVILIVLSQGEWSLAIRASNPRLRLLASTVVTLIVLDVGILVAIAVTGGFTADLGSIRVSAQEMFNPLQILWALVVVVLYLRFRPYVVYRRRNVVDVAVSRRVLTMIIAFLIVAAPLVCKGVAVILRGDYVSQTYYWRSAPKGIDAGTLVLGNPFHGIFGESIRSLYQSMNIDPIEMTAWLGIGPMLLMVWALRSKRNDPTVRRWVTVGGIFFVWALGPHLMTFGVNTGMILPQALFRYIPIVANARIPGRAMVVVYLAVAIVSAVAAADWRIRSWRGALAFGSVALMVAADYLTAPVPLTPMDRPAIYVALRNRPEDGAVCELPVGIRDGFGERGFLDHRVLFYQTIHERPLVGGVVSRLSPRVIAAYDADPLISALLRLSEPGDVGQELSLPNKQVASEMLSRNGIAFVMLNRQTASQVLINYVERVLPLRLIAEEGERSLYAVLDGSVRGT